jgi:hypothetical protein
MEGLVVSFFLQMLQEPGAFAKTAPAVAADGVVNAASLKDEAPLTRPDTARRLIPLNPLSAAF